MSRRSKHLRDEVSSCHHAHLLVPTLFFFSRSFLYSTAPAKLFEPNFNLSIGLFIRTWMLIPSSSSLFLLTTKEATSLFQLLVPPSDMPNMCAVQALWLMMTAWMLQRWGQRRHHHWGEKWPIAKSGKSWYPGWQQWKSMFLEKSINQDVEGKATS